MGTPPRWMLRLEQLERSAAALQRALVLDDYTELERAGLIQTFSLTFELCWKTAKDWLAYQGIVVSSPRETLRAAFAEGLFSDIALWLEMLEARNTVTHAYDEPAAEESARLVRDRYAPALIALAAALRARAGV